MTPEMPLGGILLDIKIIERTRYHTSKFQCSGRHVLLLVDMLIIASYMKLPYVCPHFETISITFELFIWDNKGVYRIRRGPCKCSHLHLNICLYVHIELELKTLILSSKGVNGKICNLLSGYLGWDYIWTKIEVCIL